MHRREFLMATAAVAASSALGGRAVAAHHHSEPGAANAHTTYASPKAAMQSEREKIAFVTATYAATPQQKPDFLAIVDVDPASSTYSQVIERVPMPELGDELHHFGWNACSSCHGDAKHMRRFLIVPGLKSTRVHVIDVADPRHPKMHKVIGPEEIISKTNLTGPHTVHCLSTGEIMISMLGDAKGNLPGGFLLLDDKFNVAGRWDPEKSGMTFNYDFWYQPRHNVMVSSEWGAPNTIKDGFKPPDVQAGKYGKHLHFWDWEKRRIVQTVDLGEAGLIPLEVRFHHEPTSVHGFVGAALSSSIWHWFKAGDEWKAEKVIQVDPVEQKGWPFPVPGLITDLVLSLDDRWLYFSDWLHGDVRRYDVSDPAHPKLTAQVWVGGVLGKKLSVKGRELNGGPQMLNLSLDGKRLYMTNSLYSSWDNQFYPDLGKNGSYLMQFDCAPNGGLTVNENFLVDFGKEPTGPVRAHEIRFPGGDCTSDIWV
ncbi:MAG TPA: selenium-binding family protein [Planctomycetaceae bacterium]|nr:selenium-binding family protein [Planctomycetaceae bacterium]